ncbi:MAG TPA: GAF domain-containing protein, partial [Pirellulaceae bacterium]
MDRLCLALTGATHWTFERTEFLGPDSIWHGVLSGPDPSPEFLTLSPPVSENCEPMIARASAKEVASAVHALATELSRYRKSFAELQAARATEIPVVVRRKGDEPQLALRLEQTMGGVGEAIAADAAALYVLDDATRFLPVRAQWRLPDADWLAAPRPLAEAKADLEALAGHAVVMDSPESLAVWRAPGDFAAAACVPVSSATTPLGTLWYFSERPRDFCPRDVNFMEIAAGRIAAELEREAVLRQLMERPYAGEWKGNESIGESSPVQPLRDALLSLPDTQLCVREGDWQVTSRVSPTELDRHAIVDVRPSPGERISLTGVFGEGDAIVGPSLASKAFAILRQPPGNRELHETYQLAHESLFRGSTGDHFVSAASVEIARLSGKVEILSAGHAESYI